ncbi:MAG: protein kinase [Pyrinomonadaceae bacterium]
MKPERNRQIDGVFQTALARNPAERAAFLDEACADDPDLRREVEALIASDKQANGFIESPALELAPELVADDYATSVAGRTIGPYRLESQLGAGGMGKVYLAHDQRLGRKVALKLLDPRLTGESEQRTRFLREARLAGSLDHPNICTIHEVGEAAGHLFIAMQYVEGETLRRVISGRPLQLDSLLSISLQVADALAEAHKQGIIHRDVKAGNIIITPRGQAKVLDFGLAKLLERSEGEAETHLTMTGAVMGTPASMSPEQARGERADHRSDIFSLGGVLYEMATGHTPFIGRSKADVISALLNQPHRPAAEVNKKIPVDLSAVIDQMLAKDPADRYQSMPEMIADLRQVVAQAGGLDNLFSSSAGRVGLITPYIPPRRQALLKRPWAIASLAVGTALVMLGLIAAYLWSKSSLPTAPLQQSLISTFSGSHRKASFSPDGQRIAFTNIVDNVPQIWIKTLAQGEPVQITSGEESADRPRWSPRNDQIVYTRRSQGTDSIWSVPPAGGASHKVVEGGRNPNWSWDGARLVFERGYDIWTANADGSDQQKVEGVPPTDLLLADRMPVFSPDGAHVAFFQKSKGPHGDYWVVPAAGGQARRLTFDDSFGGAPAWTPDGQFIVFPSQRAGSLTLWKVPAVGGEPQPVLGGTGEDTDPEISRDGRRLIFTNTRNSYIVTLTDQATGGQKELYQSRSDLVDPSFSPQGDKILFFGFAEGGGIHLYIVNADGTNINQLTRGKGEQNVHPQWSADGSAVYFYQHRPTTSFRKISLHDGSITELARGWEWGTHNHARVNPEGTRIIYTRLDKGKPAATMIRDISTGGETAFTQLLRFVRWSRDGKFIAGTNVKESWSDAEITVCAVDGGVCRALTRGWFPQWSSDGTLIYFYKVSSLRDGEELWAISRDGVGERKVVDLRPLHPIGEFSDVASTGQIVWVQYRAGKHELWLRDLPAS